MLTICESQINVKFEQNLNCNCILNEFTNENSERGAEVDYLEIHLHLFTQYIRD